MSTRKVLVRRNDDTVIGLYKSPLQFSIGNFYVIDIPDSISFNSLPGDVGSVYSSKVSGLIALNPTLSQHFSADVTELPLHIDSSLSRGYILNKQGVSLTPNGTIITQQYTPVSGFSNIYLHYYGFLFSRVASSISGSPASILYNYNTQLGQFVEFDPTSIQVSVTDAAGTTSLFFPTVDAVFAASFSTFRLKFVNLSSQNQRVSEFYLLYDGVPPV